MLRATLGTANEPSLKNAAANLNAIFSTPNLLARLYMLVFFMMAFIGSNPAAFAQDGFLGKCFTGRSDNRIAACSRIIDSRRKMTKAHRIEVYLSRAAAYQSQGDFGHALLDLDRALELDPGSTGAFIFRASLHRALGELQSAIADYSAALAIKPGLFQALLGRAEVYRETMDFGPAVHDYSKLIELYPELTSAYDGRAKAYRDLGEVDRSLVDFNEVVRRSPCDGMIMRRAPAPSRSPRYASRRFPAPTATRPCRRRSRSSHRSRYERRAVRVRSLRTRRDRRSPARAVRCALGGTTASIAARKSDICGQRRRRALQARGSLAQSGPSAPSITADCPNVNDENPHARQILRQKPLRPSHSRPSSDPSRDMAVPRKNLTSENPPEPKKSMGRQRRLRSPRRAS